MWDEVRGDELIHVLRVRHQVDVGHHPGDVLDPAERLLAEECRAGAGDGRVADELDAVVRHVRQHAELDGAADIEVVAEAAGEADPLDVVHGHTDALDEDGDGGVDGGLRADEIAHVGLGQHDVVVDGGLLAGDDDELKLAVLLDQPPAAAGALELAVAAEHAGAVHLGQQVEQA